MSSTRRTRAGDIVNYTAVDVPTGQEYEVGSSVCRVAYFAPSALKVSGSFRSFVQRMDSFS
jgi:hypothetical protein